MEFVNPIKEIEKINKMKLILKNKSDRDLLLFVLGINTGIRISDLLHLKVSDMWDGEKTKEYLLLKGEEGQVHEHIYLNSIVRQAFVDYIKRSNFQKSDYLFKSKKDKLPISRQQAYRIINQAAKEAGIEEKIGTHTLRKTFGYHAFQKGIALSLIMERFNHTTPAETLRYININSKDEAQLKVDVNL